MISTTNSCSVEHTTASVVEDIREKIRLLDDTMTDLYCETTKKSSDIGKEIEHSKVLAASDLISTGDKVAVYLNKFRLHQRRVELWENLASAHSALMDERRELEIQLKEFRLRNYDDDLIFD